MRVNPRDESFMYRPAKQGRQDACCPLDMVHDLNFAAEESAECRLQIPDSGRKPVLSW